MLIRYRNFFTALLLTALMLAFVCGASCAQQVAGVDIRQLVPPDSLLVAVLDLRPENPSIQIIQNSETPETREQLEKQRADLHKAIEDFATLFGIPLDWTKDVQSWHERETAVVLLPEGKNNAQLVMMIASKDAAAANAFLQKILVPLQRTGEVIPQPDQDFPITAYKLKHKGGEVYFSAYGPVVAFALSKDALKHALKGGGFVAGSPGDKVFNALSGSFFYAYAAPAILDLCGMDSEEFPVEGAGLGVSALETGYRLRALGLVNEEVAQTLQQMLAPQQGALSINPGIPSPSLVAASLPNVSGLVGMFGMAAPKNPLMGAAQAISDTQVSAALTAILPVPAGVATAMAASDQAAAEKLALITGTLKQLKMPVESAGSINGIQVTRVGAVRGKTLYMAQVGQYIAAASDIPALAGAAATIRGEQPGTVQSAAYTQTIAGLGDSNIFTLYANMAPVQGVGYLINGLGLGQLQPIYGSVAKGLENMQALGLGVGFNNQIADVTLFLRAKPGEGITMGPAVVTGTAIAAAVLYPMLSRSRQAPQQLTEYNELRQLAAAACMYANEHNGKLPTIANWRSQLERYLMPGFMFNRGDVFYAFNKNLGGLNVNKILNPYDVVIFFESRPGLPNASGSRADALLPHEGKGFFAYVDGHAMKQAEVPSQSHWVPKYAASQPVKKAPAKPVKKAGSYGRR